MFGEFFYSNLYSYKMLLSQATKYRVKVLLLNLYNLAFKTSTFLQTSPVKQMYVSESIMNSYFVMHSWVVSINHIFHNLVQKNKRLDQLCLFILMPIDQRLLLILSLAGISMLNLFLRKFHECYPFSFYLWILFDINGMLHKVRVQKYKLMCW